MKKSRKRRLISRILVSALAVAMLLPLFSSCSAKNRTFSDISELNSKDITLAIQTGTVFDELLKENFPEANIEYYSAIPDMSQAIISGKIDSFPSDYPVARLLCTENPELTFLNTVLDPVGYAFVFPKTERGKLLSEQVSAYIKKIKADGTLKEISELWISGKEEDKVLDFSGLTGENGKITLATEAVFAPFSYIKDGEIVGIDTDIILRFCREYGYSLEIMNMAFDAVIPSLGTRADIGGSGISITEERKEQVYFSESYFDSGTVMIVKRDSSKAPDSLEDLSHSDIGILTGSIYEAFTVKRFPDANISYYSNRNDMAIAVTNGILDGFICAQTTADQICTQNSALCYLDEHLDGMPSAAAFAKTSSGNKLLAEYNEYLAELDGSGELDELYEIWTSFDESKKIADRSVLTGENGTVKLATSSASPPFSYVRDGENVGLDIAIAIGFCKKYGYALEIYDMDFSALIPAVVSGTCDFASGDITETDERKQSVNFSNPLYLTEGVVVVRADDSSGGSFSAFITSLKESFEKTFIREARWKLILKGIGITLLITVLAALFGTLLGFGICMLRLTKSRIAKGITTVYIRVLQGTPIVVILMILFYLVFAKTGLGGIWVAVIGFALNFAAYVSEMMRTGIEAVDPGQKEAALALGYTKAQTFFRIILPQAARHFLPVYTGELVSLAKSTSIVGYIAIQDLTKVSDIIRSRTYEAFFPLIATAAIYFILSWLLSLVLNLLRKKVEPNRIKRSVKGVDSL